MPESDERVVDWTTSRDTSSAPPSPAPIPRGRAIAWLAGAVGVVLVGNAVAGWIGGADERLAEGRAGAVESLFTALNEGDRESYLSGGLDRVARAGLSWGFLQRLGDDEVAVPRAGDTTVTAACTAAGPHTVRCDLRQRGGPFAGLDTRARGYFLVDETGTVRRSWIELQADEQRLATFLRDVRSRLAEVDPATYQAVFDTELPLLHRQAFRDTLANRQRLTDALTPPGSTGTVGRAAAVMRPPPKHSSPSEP